MRAWLFVLALAACKYTPPEPGATGDASNDGAPVDEAVIDPIDAPPGAWMHPYLHRKRITLIASKIDDTGGALTNFPVLISLDDGDLAAATNLPDMAFTAGDATTQLDSEIESYAAGKLVAWVRIPELSATQNTQLFLYYGNPAPPPTNPANVWSGQFLGVWHFSQDPGPAGNDDIADASAHDNDGTASSSMDPADSVVGQVGRGLRFDGANDFVDFPTSMDVGNNFTISLWANLDATSPGTANNLMANSGQNFNTDGFRFFINTANTSNRRVLFETGDGTNGSNCETANNAVTAGTWAHLVAVIDRGNGSGKIFVNGVESQTTTGVQNDFDTSSNWEVGRMESASLFYKGMIDEVSVANVRRPAGWILTTYNNQFSPSTFYMVDDAENEP